ncbi:MAG: F0F1 ATP synthase subunit B' [Alphaproteobacteria bacterium]|nr:F0F1 ATP synthase subunit B' [Alphaproteobacteria bacterium]
MAHLWMALAAAAAEEAEGIVAAAETSSGGLPQMDFSTYPSQLFWLAVTFGTLYAVMSSAILPRLGGAIEDRRDRIADDLDQAAEFRRQAEEAEKAYQTSLADARAKAQSIAAETRSEMEAEIASMQAEADDRATAKIAAAEAKIDEMKDKAAANVRAAAADVAREIVGALIDEKPTDETIAAAIAKSVR